ncbi:2'-5' RNA ligase family protein [Kamptonema animale CS-326]|jgi:2'-5' RNA ligase|uniref:2'-5' RNA ligase family protein n=1 Tax=Kamptonema animale TaxID=92934 RepID=UPI00232D67CA|nr:2'-5' RNA ligase family protein [Kamptonema animale]MDB9512399.1 2'-5' RNA ligase family protein [Kamptonema animale CS-326]
MENLTHRYFIALLPPQEIQEQITEIKQYFAKKYASSGALKSPPHITLQPPFKWVTEEIGKVEECLEKFAIARHPIPITLSGFAAFPPRVIYANPLKIPELLDIQKDLMADLETTLGIIDPVSKSRSFTPHLTVAFRDLTKENFKAAWLEFERRSLNFEFTASQLTLLIHDGERWNISREFPFSL